MTAVMAQMFAGREPLNEETAFDIEFTDEHIADGIYCQVQFEITPRAGFDAVGVDWGDGTKQDWPKASRTMAHNWSARGRYRVRFDSRSCGATSSSPRRGRTAAGADFAGRSRNGGSP